MRFFWLAVVVLSSLCPVPAAAAKRVALVIGNSGYQAVGALPNPVKDASVIAKTLQSLGFETDLATDLTAQGFRDALKTFSGRSQTAEIALVYYAGHGVEFDGTNFLVPVDAKLARKGDVRFEAIALEDVREAASGASKLRLVILDACRNNPFPMLGKDGTRGVSRGLAKVEPGANELVAYAARENTVAGDGDGDNSPFAAALAKRLGEPGVEINFLFRRVRDDVLQATGNSQEPFVYGTLGVEEIYLNPAAVVAAPEDPAKTALADPVSKAANGSCNAILVNVAGSEDCLKPGSVFRDAESGPQMVVLPAGVSLMGSSPQEIALLKKQYAASAEFFDSEATQITVRIPQALAVGRSHVTRGEFAAFAEATGFKSDGGCDVFDGKDWKTDAAASWQAPGFAQDNQHPVVCVNVDEALAYAKWLSDKTGKTYRLLSEAEAEYAARGAVQATPQPRYFFGDKDRDLCTYANVADRTGEAKFPSWSGAPCKDGFVFTAPVASFKPNPFGLYDVAGNVWTWTSDCWNDTNAGNPGDGSARTSGDCNFNVIRGGSWLDGPQLQRTDLRNYNRGARRYNVLGFRIARTIDP